MTANSKCVIKNIKNTQKIGELYSAISHSVGALLSIAGFVLMLIKVNYKSK